MRHAHAAPRHHRPARRLCELQRPGAAARAHAVGRRGACHARSGRRARSRPRHRSRHAPRAHRERLAAHRAREAGRQPPRDGRVRTSARERRRRGDPAARWQRRGCGCRGRVRARRRRARCREHRRPPGHVGSPPELARTVELIAGRGTKVFCRGQIADLMVREMERGGGLITRDDLGRYRAKWRAPLQIDYRGYTVYTMPPPSGGGVTLAEILNTMEGFGPLPAFGSARLLHLQAEAMRRAYADRNAFLGDPDFVSLPLKRLVSKSYAAELRAAIDPGRATGTTSAPVVEAEEDTSTTHYSIVDADGGAGSCPTTLNNDFGSAVTVTGAGFLLNDEMDDFATAPAKPNLSGLVPGEPTGIR